MKLKELLEQYPAPLTEEKIEALSRELLNYSYCPYSKFKVSCIITMKDGEYFVGVNVENASYGLTICAERSAIFDAITKGYRMGEFDKFYCMTGAVVNNVNEVSASCGACLQVMSEFMEEDRPCIYMDYEGKKRTFTLKEMMPYAFTVKDLQLENAEGFQLTKKL